jgi:hypothetical protein
MSLTYSPKIATDGLLMCLDASNNKSYPTDLPVKNGLVMWMDAADDTTFSYSSGTTVSQWRDKSGFNYHMGPKVNGPTRSVVLNSRKVLAFTTAQTIGNNTINLSTSANTVFVVSRLTGTTNGRVLTCNLDSSGNNWLLGHHGGTYNDYYAEGWVSDGGSFDTNWRMYMGDWSGTSTDLANLYSNGTAITTNSSAASQGPKYLGVNYYSNEVSTCEVAEIVVFDRVLSATERKQVNTYLGQKWGISNTDRSIVDLSNNNNNGLFGNATVANMPLYDFYNKGTLKFDGTNDYASGFGSSIVPTSTVQYTVSMWVYRTRNNVGYEELLSQWTSANSGNSFFFGFNNSNVRFTDNWNDVVVSGAGNTNIWMNLVGVYTVSNAFIYLNGVLVATRGSGFSYTGTGPLILGRQGELASEYFGGNISNVLIYNKALSATEIAQNYEAQKSKFANTIVQQGLVLNLDAGNSYSYGGAGTTFYDVSPTALSWTINNATYNSSDPKYFSYNGSNSWLESSTSAAYDSQTITMECWCYPNSLNQLGFIFEKGAVNTQYSMFFENANFQFRTMGLSNQDVTITSTSFMTVNAWNHIVCTYTSGNKITYINGVQAGGLSGITGTLNTGGTNQYIGKYGNAGNNYQFNGRIGESRVYNIALSAAQVLQNYNATKGRFGL